MSSITITSFFAKNGLPQTGLQPIIRIWETDTKTLVVGNSDVYMSSMTVNPNENDGLYIFEFTAGMGYSINKNYIVRVDGGATLYGNDRYQTSHITPTQDVVNAILDEPILNHLVPGSFGEKVIHTSANVEQLVLSLYDVNILIGLLLKYEKNRTMIDVSKQTLTVFDDDCVTPLRTFKLYDQYGNPSVADVCERVPVSEDTADGLSTCN